MRDIGPAALVLAGEGVQRVEGVGAELGETEGHGTRKAPAPGEGAGLGGGGWRQSTGGPAKDSPQNPHTIE